MKYSWSKSVFPIAAIFSFRMLGLFMLIPVFTIFATQLNYSTPTLIGIALGSYGLSQGLLQIPFGVFSDKYGRKNMIAIGLTLFAIGSFLGALTHSIYGMITARILQGMGAIGSVLIALIADLTTDKERTKAMAIIGMAIGVSFSLAMILSPLITDHYGLSGIFYLTATLAISGLLLLYSIIPNPHTQCIDSKNKTNLSLIKSTLANKHLQCLNAGIFLQHLILTSTFFVIPLVLQDVKRGHLGQHWHFYLPIMLISFILMGFFIYFAEKKNGLKQLFLIAILTTSLAQLILAFTYHQWLCLIIFMLIYFSSFNILEASLPSLISKQATAYNKGTAMGIYSSCQFLGIFIGGLMAGIFYQYTSISFILSINALLGILWLIIALNEHR